MVLGDNTSIDHILPVSRYPEKSKDIDNLEWVTLTVNLMKRNRTADEFMELVKQIAKYREGA